MRHHARSQVLAAHGRLFRTMRPGAGGGSGSHRLRPHERTGPAPRGGSSGARKRVAEGHRLKPVLPKKEVICAYKTSPHSAPSRKRASPSCCPTARASPSAWAPAATATAPKASSTPSPKPFTSAGAMCAWPRPAAKYFSGILEPSRGNGEGAARRLVSHWRSGRSGRERKLEDCGPHQEPDYSRVGA